MVTEKFSIGEIAQLAGISRRAVRYYVQFRILSPPLGSGRGHYYTRDHLETLRKVKFFQDEGLSLEEIRLRLNQNLYETGFPSKKPKFLESPRESFSSDPFPGGAPGERFGNPSQLWVRIPLIEGLEIFVQNGVHRATPARVTKLIKAAREIFGLPE